MYFFKQVFCSSVEDGEKGKGNKSKQERKVEIVSHHAPKTKCRTLNQILDKLQSHFQPFPCYVHWQKKPVRKRGFSLAAGHENLT